MSMSLKDRLLLRKDVDKVLAETRAKGGLAKNLTAFDLTVLGVGAIIGVGIFVLAGVGATRAGPAIPLSFAIAGLVCALAGLCYAELAAAVPTSGAAYGYTYLALGELPAWILGWALVLEYGVGSIAVAIGWSGYVTGLLDQVGLVIPAALRYSPFDPTPGLINLPAVLIVAVITALLVKGTKESAKAAGALVILKVAIILFVIIMGIGFVGLDGANFTAGGGFMPFGVSGLFAGAAIIFFAYIGFDAVATTAEEAKNPGRDLPIGILGSLFICTALYLLAATVMVGLIPWTAFEGNAEALAEPFAFVFREAGYDWIGNVIAAGAVAGITSVLMVLLMAGPRVFFALSRDRLAPPAVAKVHPKWGTPYISTAVTGITVAIVAGFLPLGKAAEITNIGTLFAFTMVCLSVIFLRRSHPQLERPFRVPLYPAVPILGALGTVSLIFSLELFTHFGFLAWMGAGLMVYALYGVRNSKAFAESGDVLDVDAPAGGPVKATGGGKD